MSIIKDILCDFCNTPEINELNTGKIYVLGSIKIHYFCLLLSSNAIVTGEDEEGIMGFMPKAIQNEIKRGNKIKCSYCKRNRATLGCDYPRCSRVFHLPCGINAGTISQFYDQFPSFCERHVPIQNFTKEDQLYSESTGNENNCKICFDPVVPKVNINSLWTSCCRNGWFHRNCVQKLAVNAGQFFFKCPLCNNTNEFANEMKRMGIYVPEQDASWENDEYAFQDLLYRHNKCDAKKCLCSNGRKYNKPGTIWIIILCRMCGSSGAHIGCKRLSQDNPSYSCDTCGSCNVIRRKRKVGKRKSQRSPLLQKQLKKRNAYKKIFTRKQGRTVMLKPEERSRLSNSLYTLRPRNKTR